MKFDVIQFEEIDSTNTYLYNLAKSGAEEGTVVMASYAPRATASFPNIICFIRNPP